MRYSLRNQDKIKNSFGEDFHKWLMLSITEHFKNNSEIDELTYPSEKYKIIHAKN